ncbi:nuclease Le3 [Lentinula aciculospora]|uniref:Nuclease Le3 n=1 Tax=Lentinula aciculospora TaxID=153920 RepID=A0A9W8ZZS5_9AGAR|nr:nuclease Le3 [Lentinula aciculospora]
MKFSSSFVLLGLSLAAGQVHGWGMKGYEARVICVQFLAPEASRFVETSLSGPQYYSSLGLAAAWADEVRRQKGYGWSAPLHFVDAEDHPPTECSVNQKRDCSRNGCILTAIANYTSRVVDTTLSDSDRQEALKFFVGDIGQPLHVQGVDRGGNSIHVKCAGRKSNLHTAYDGIIDKLLDDQYDSSRLDHLRTWVQLLPRVYEHSNCTRIIAKQGYRLAAWLTVLFDGKTNLP